MTPLILSLLCLQAFAGDGRWEQVAARAERPEVREFALHLAHTEVDPDLELAAARLIRSLEPHLDHPSSPELELPPAMRAADALTAEIRVERARAAWLEGDVYRALRLLEPVREDAVARVLYSEAVDAWVGAERERLGARYFSAKSLDRATRKHELEAVQRGLAQLMDRYPDSAYADALASNLERVERELEGWP